MLKNTLTKQSETYSASYKTSDYTKSCRIINTPSEFAKEHLFYIQEAGHLISLKSHISEREHLNSYLFLIVLSGSGRFTYLGKDNKLKAGDCLLINCCHHYSHQSCEEDPWELMWVHFNGRNIKPFITFYEITIPEIVFQTEVITEFTTIIDNCIELEKKNDIISEFLISKMLTDLMTLCITRKKTKKVHNNNKKMKSIKEYIDINYKNKLSLENIANEFFISKYYLAREFKKQYGMTIGEYLASRRITYSKELLRFTDKKIEEIALLCGIPDSNYFSKLFRSLEDCNPSEYRKKW